MGATDDNIILMLADDTACNPRNPAPCQVYHHPNHALNLLDEGVQIDYKGPDVTVGNFMDVMAGASAILVSSKPSDTRACSQARGLGAPAQAAACQPRRRPAGEPPCLCAGLSF